MLPWLEQWVLGGSLVDTIIAITLLEAAGLLFYHHQTKRGMKPRDYLLNMISGLCLMLALRCILSGASWHLVAICLVGAGLAHIADICLRLREYSKIS